MISHAKAAILLGFLLALCGCQRSGDPDRFVRAIEGQWFWVAGRGLVLPKELAKYGTLLVVQDRSFTLQTMSGRGTPVRGQFTVEPLSKRREYELEQDVVMQFQGKTVRTVWARVSPDALWIGCGADEKSVPEKWRGTPELIQFWRDRSAHLNGSHGK